MEVKINLKIFAFAVLFFITGQLEIYGILMLFACIHELGHLLFGILLGFKPKSIHIMPLGLCINFYVFPKDYNQKIMNSNCLKVKKIIIAAAGPVTNFFFAIFFSLYPINILGIVPQTIIYANLLIGIFNLIPIYPLDGGRIIKNIFSLLCGYKRALIFTNKLSNITMILLTMISSILICYYKNIAILLIIIYLWILVVFQNRKYQMKMNLYQMLEK